MHLVHNFNFASAEEDVPRTSCSLRIARVNDLLSDTSIIWTQNSGER